MTNDGFGREVCKLKTVKEEFIKMQKQPENVEKKMKETSEFGGNTKAVVTELKYTV